MGEKLPFPYKFEDLKPEEEALVKTSIGTTPASFIRLGPKGYMVFKTYKKDAENINNMPLRPTDVFVASYQRSGTTWAQELVWLIANDLNYEKAAEIPLVHRYSFIEYFMFFDEETIEEYVELVTASEENIDKKKYTEMLRTFSTPVTPLLAAAPLTSKRFIKTHLPMSLLPPKLLDTAKTVYVARDPRDVAVSCYHHAKLLRKVSRLGSFKDFWNLFRRDLYSLTPYFEHVKEAWEKRDDTNMLFLFYEDLSKDLPASIRRVADFFGKQLNEEQMNRLSDHLSFENFKNNPSVNFEDIMREMGFLTTGETFIRKENLVDVAGVDEIEKTIEKLTDLEQNDKIRTQNQYLDEKATITGKIGGWRAYFDEQMTQEAERWIEENLLDTDLRFPHMNR